MQVLTWKETLFEKSKQGYAFQLIIDYFQRLPRRFAPRNDNEHLGRFDDEIEAAVAYDRKAAELFGEFAYLNFPTTDYTDAVPRIVEGSIKILTRTDAD